LLGAAAGARGDPPLILGCAWNPRVCDAPTLAGSGGLFAFATWGAELHATLWRFNGNASTPAEALAKKVVTWGAALVDAATVAAKQQQGKRKGGGGGGGGAAAPVARPRAVLCGLFGGWGALLLGTDRYGSSAGSLATRYY
jgi:hypothetical protein